LLFVIAAEVGQNNGFSAKATLGEVGWENDWFGAKVGLSTDTQMNVGTSGVTAKVLGTGFSSTNRGFEMCFFGSCVRFG
jgi:hypothetical protein